MICNMAYLGFLVPLTWGEILKLIFRGLSRYYLHTYGSIRLDGANTMVPFRDAIFRKMTNRNQTDTNEMATTETKYQTDFYSAEKYQY